MRTFQVYFATSFDPDSETGVWSFELVEDREVIFKWQEFEIEKTNSEKLELYCVSSAIKNLENVRSQFRILICYHPTQFASAGRSHREKMKWLQNKLRESGADLSSEKYSVELNQVEKSNKILTLKSVAAKVLLTKLATEYI